MKRIATLIALSIASAANASYPVGGYKYVTGVTSGMFENLSAMQHVWNYWGSDMPLYGEDICIMKEAALARSVENGGSIIHLSTGITSEVSSNQFCYIINLINWQVISKSLGTPLYKWFKVTPSNNAILTDITELPHESIFDTASYVMDLVFHSNSSYFYTTYNQLAGISAESNMANVVSRDLVNRGFKALYKLKDCGVDIESWNDSVVNRTVLYDGRDTPTTNHYFGVKGGIFVDRTVYQVAYQAETGSHQTLAAYRYMQTDEVDSGLESCSSYSGSLKRYYLYEVFRRKVDWSQYAYYTTITRKYVFAPSTVDYADIITASGLSDDVPTKEIDETLTNNILATRGACTLIDDFMITVVAGFAIKTYNSSLVWDSAWE